VVTEQHFVATVRVVISLFLQMTKLLRFLGISAVLSVTAVSYSRNLHRFCSVKTYTPYSSFSEYCQLFIQFINQSHTPDVFLFRLKSPECFSLFSAWNNVCMCWCFDLASLAVVETANREAH
jgi:hypothetical protein